MASNSIFCPSSVTAGVCSRRDKRPRSSSPWRCLKPYSARMMGEGSTTTTPASPSMMTQSSWRTNWLLKRAPTTAGMSRLRATMAVCEVLPPTSVIKPANTLCLNCSMSEGDKSCATKISGTSTVSSSNRSCCEGLRVLRALGVTTGEATPFMARSTFSAICSRSALRSRRYSSSISSNWRAITSSWVVSAHSALYRRSVIQCLTPLMSSTSSSSIRCTSSKAVNSCGASLGPMWVMLAWSRRISSTTALRPARTRSISDAISSGLMK